MNSSGPCRPSTLDPGPSTPSSNPPLIRREAVAEATRRGKLRPNSVDSITGKNSGDNLGPGTPIIHFDQWERDAIEVKLILKGGGCENTNAQYSLPWNCRIWAAPIARSTA